MNAKFNRPNNHQQHLLGDLKAGSSGNNNLPQGVIQTMMRDRFELLSAYLDGEVTAAERRQVENWLATDPAIRQLYNRLLKLRSGFQSMPVSPTQQSSAEMAAAVFKRIDKKPKLTVIWGGTAIAAMLIAAFCGILPGRETMPQLAESPAQPLKSDGLMIALNEPVVEVVTPNSLMLTVNQPVVEIPKADGGSLKNTGKPN